MHAAKWPKLIVDPVHKIISFEDDPCDRLLLELINTKEFQRLRRIKQLGMSEMVFPGSNHSRFAHSIGVMHTSKMFLERIGRLKKGGVSDLERVVVLTASLLHDLGHGPFSHAFEKVTNENHESRTAEIISNGTTEVHQKLKAHDQKLPKLLEAFFESDPGSSGIPAYFTQIVSSQLDADRFDYLLRDSYATGTNYGDFDIRWLIQHVQLDEARGRLFVDRKAFITAEAYVFARYHMYRTVYFHKTTRSAEVMLRLLFKRYADLLKTATSTGEKQAIAPGAPASVFAAFQGPISLEQYLSLDDFTVSEFMKACEGSTDPTLRNLGSGLIHRRLYKATLATDIEGIRIGKFNSEVAAKLSALGRDPAYSFIADSIADTPYKPYNPSAEEQAMQIFVETASGDGQVEISVDSGPIRELTKKYNLLRYYYPAEIRNEIESIAQNTLH